MLVACARLVSMSCLRRRLRWSEGDAPDDTVGCFGEGAKRKHRFGATGFGFAQMVETTLAQQKISEPGGS